MKRSLPVSHAVAEKKLPVVVRIQRKDGRVVQDCDVYIGRACYRGGWSLPQSKWYNPFTAKKCGSVGGCVQRFEEYARASPELMGALGELVGKRLGCWCKTTPSKPCHGDVLVKLVREMLEEAEAPNQKEEEQKQEGEKTEEGETPKAKQGPTTKKRKVKEHEGAEDKQETKAPAATIPRGEKQTKREEKEKERRMKKRFQGSTKME